MSLYTHQVCNIFFFNRFVDLVVIIVQDLDHLDEECIVRLDKLVPKRLNQEIDPFRVCYMELFPIVSYDVGIITNDNDWFSTYPIDNLVDPRALTDILIGVVLVLIDLNNDTMGGQIKIDVWALLATSLEHLARIVLKLCVDFFS
jgi:hypothetical protein